MRNTVVSLLQWFTSFFRRERPVETTETYWCFIPEGRVLIQGVRGSYVTSNSYDEFDVPPMMMAKYPVTNAQYGRFIDDGGYHERAYWTEEGWYNRQREDWHLPKYWNDPQFNKPDYPVVGVTWYEAMAFVMWLRTSDDPLIAGLPHELRVSLPTEQQWQRAAAGDDRRQYPWGIDFDPSKANTKEAGFDRTTPVRQYKGAESPFGVADMAGNVLEWTLTDWGTGSTDPELPDSSRIMRGGSFANSHRIATVYARTYSNAYFRRPNFGFRLCGVPMGLF